jgi:hypothetical protein
MQYSTHLGLLLAFGGLGAGRRLGARRGGSELGIQRSDRGGGGVRGCDDPRQSLVYAQCGDGSTLLQLRPSALLTSACCSRLAAWGRTGDFVRVWEKADLDCTVVVAGSTAE